MEGFGCNVSNCRWCAGEASPATAPIDAETAARMVAVLCASILAAAAEKDHAKVLATSDIYLDFIRPAVLQPPQKKEHQ